MDITDAVAEGGRFSIDIAAVPDGAVTFALTFALTVIDVDGRRADAAISLVLDRTPPQLMSVDLTSETDTGERGDLRTAVGVDAVLEITVGAGATVAVADVAKLSAGAPLPFAIGPVTEAENPVIVTMTDRAGNRREDVVTIVGEPVAIVPPRRTLDGPADTGGAPIAAVRAQVAAETFEITDAVGVDGRFTVDVAALAGLGQGAFDVAVTVVVEGGGEASARIAAVLDTVAPVIDAPRLTPESDTGEPGDGATALRRVDLVGVAEPGAVVSARGIQAAAGPDGVYRLSGVAFVEGENVVVITATDGAGDVAAASALIVGLPRARGDGELTLSVGLATARSC